MKGNNGLVPKRRFKEFENAGDWKKGELGELVDVYDGTHQTPKYTDSGVMFLSVENIKTLKSEKYISQKAFDSEYKVFPEKDDVLMTRIGDIGTANVVESNEDKAYYVSLGLLKKKELDPYFLKESIHSEPVKRELWHRTLHIAFPKKINKNEISKVSINYPDNAEEQEKIGMFFKEIDNLMTLQKQKLEKIKDLKSGYLSDMFPKEGEKYPKIRFERFTDSWEQCKWVDTVDISTNMVDPKTGDYDDLIHIGPGNIESFTGRILDNVNTVKEDNLISGKFHFNEGDVIYGKINPQLGKYAYASSEGLASADSYVLNAINGLDQTFLFTLLQTQDFFNYSVSVSMRSGMPKINRNELNAYSFMAPCYNEQMKIGKFFLNLDNLITFHQRKLEKLKNTKQAYLNEMFI